MKAEEAARERAIKLLKEAELTAFADELADNARPTPMLLWCPSCHVRHIDVGVFTTKLHHTHACQGCGMVWRPALVNTIGVKFLPGFQNLEPLFDFTTTGRTTSREPPLHHLHEASKPLDRSDGPIIEADYASIEQRMAAQLGVTIKREDVAKHSFATVYGMDVGTEPGTTVEALVAIDASGKQEILSVGDPFEVAPGECYVCLGKREPDNGRLKGVKCQTCNDSRHIHPVTRTQIGRPVEWGPRVACTRCPSEPAPSTEP
jgi:hypothetical protein